MNQAAQIPVPSPAHPVWAALQAYEIGPADAALSFLQRLARDNGWTIDHGARVLDEYKRFCFLAVTADHPVTPSDAVDQAWHLHLTYSRDYWERFCPDVLGRPLHHGPTAGGAIEHRRYHEQYAQTLRSYEQTFGEAPPFDLWPDAYRRLVEDPKARRVHPRDAIVIRRQSVRAVVAAVVTLMIGAVAVMAAPWLAGR